MANDDNFTPADIVYAGLRYSRGTDEFIVSVYVLQPDGTLGKEQFYDASKNWRKLTRAGTYRGAAFTETKIRGHNNLSFVKLWDNREQRIEWQALEEAAETLERSKKFAADSKKVNDIEEIMLPLRTQYAGYIKRFDYASREALERAVIVALHTPPRKSEL